MSFKELSLLKHYKTYKNDIIKEFYTPVLKQAVLYQRAVGFFSSTALIDLTKGISGMIKNGGRISIYVIMIVSKVYDREEPWKPKTSGAFCASSDENAVLARVFEEHRDNEKTCFRVMEGSEHMPYRSNIPCKHPGCAALIPHGQMYCEEHKPLHTKDRAHAAERGYGAKWQRERRKFLESNPFCVKCYEEGHITMATVVDHIVPHRGDQKLFWDRGNWQPLCEHHHNVKTMTEDRFKEYRF